MAAKATAGVEDEAAAKLSGLDQGFEITAEILFPMGVHLRKRIPLKTEAAQRPFLRVCLATDDFSTCLLQPGGVLVVNLGMVIAQGLRE